MMHTLCDNAAKYLVCWFVSFRKHSVETHTFFFASYCIDGDITTMCHTNGGESFPWVTLVIPRSIVRTVRITNRVDCCGERMENVKIWVGEQFPSTSNVEYSGVS